MSPSFLLLVAAAFAQADSPSREMREARATPNGVLLDFSATWCGPCQQMNPIISKLEREGYAIRRVDIDQEKALAQQYGVASIPCFVLVVNGREVNRITGATGEAQLRRLCQQIPAAKDDGSASQPKAPAPKKNFPLPLPQPNDFSDTYGARGQEGEEKFTSTGPLAASTRIQVRDDKGINFGTGTIIESKPGRTVILTCSHIFRSMTETSTIEVNVFEGKKNKKYVGRLLATDPEGDVGLITVPTDSVLPSVKVAPLSGAVKVETPLVSIGCSGGEAPTAETVKVTELNRYMGPDNIECTGLPVAGRSGGGIFSKADELVGVCFAADQKERRGLYAGLKPIHALLAKAKLKSGAGSEGALAGEPPFEPDTHAGRPPRARSTPPRELEEDTLGEESPFGAPAAGTLARGVEAPASLDASTAAAVAGAGEAEVICIIRPKTQQDASRVVIINRASPRFLNYLQGELRTQPRPTSGRVEFPKRTDTAPKPPETEPTVRVARHEPEQLQRYQRSPESR